MSIPRLPEATPSRTTRMTTRHRVQTVRFGGGRAVRIRDGNNIPEISWQVVWDGLTAARAEEINAFFIARNGVEGFIWQPPGASAAQTFICTEWHVIPINAEFSRIDARLQRLQ